MAVRTATPQRASFEIPIAPPRRRPAAPRGVAIGVLAGVVAGSATLAFGVLDVAPVRPAAAVSAVSAVSDLVASGDDAVADLSAQLAKLVPHSAPVDAGVVSAFSPKVAWSPQRPVGMGRVQLGSPAAPIVVSIALARTSSSCESKATCRTWVRTPSADTQSVVSDLPGGLQVQVVQWRDAGSPHTDVVPLTDADLVGLATDEVWTPVG